MKLAHASDLLKLPLPFNFFMSERQKTNKLLDSKDIIFTLPLFFILISSKVDLVSSKKKKKSFLIKMLNWMLCCEVMMFHPFIYYLLDFTTSNVEFLGGSHFSVLAFSYSRETHMGLPVKSFKENWSKDANVSIGIG